jgi:hypothetical protein
MSNLWDLVEQIIDPQGWREAKAAEYGNVQKRAPSLQQMYQYQDERAKAYKGGAEVYMLKELGNMERDKWFQDMQQIHQHPETQIYRASKTY